MCERKKEKQRKVTNSEGAGSEHIYKTDKQGKRVKRGAGEGGNDNDT